MESQELLKTSFKLAWSIRGLMDETKRGTGQMKRYEEPEIKLRPDGSIDTAHYMTIGREMRAAKAHEMIKEIQPKPKFLSLLRPPLTAHFAR